MHEQNLAIVKGLVCVAWADGKIAAEETELIEGLLQAFRATPSEVHEIRLFARQPRSLDDVPLTDLAADDRRVLLHYAVLITFVDREQSEREREFLGRLAARLNLPVDESERIVSAAEVQAQSLVHLLNTEIDEVPNRD
jgi:uncharacterized membrane protein YebE (DUF533 family)